LIKIKIFFSSGDDEMMRCSSNNNKEKKGHEVHIKMRKRGHRSTVYLSLAKWWATYMQYDQKGDKNSLGVIKSRIKNQQEGGGEEERRGEES
jgi:hypothetical protein